MVSLIFRQLSSSGITLISFVFSSTHFWPRHSSFSSTALTIWFVFWFLLPFPCQVLPSVARSLFILYITVEHFIPPLLEIFQKSRQYNCIYSLDHIMERYSIWKFQIIPQKILMLSAKHLHFHPVICISQQCKKDKHNNIHHLVQNLFSAWYSSWHLHSLKVLS